MMKKDADLTIAELRWEIIRRSQEYKNDWEGLKNDPDAENLALLKADGFLGRGNWSLKNGAVGAYGPG